MPATPDRAPPATLVLRNLVMAWGRRTYVMAILNLTPDSFSGDGLGTDVAAAVDRAAVAVAAGADILDVGGESTRPGAAAVSAAEETERVVPVIRALRARFDIPISVDTYKATVAAAAIAVGADMVNDVWGLRADPEMAGVVARAGVPAVLMHNRSDAALARVVVGRGGHYVGTNYHDLLGEVCQDLRGSVDLARAAGVPPSHILLDPGLGFGKTVAQNLDLLDQLATVRALGYPVLVGPSRKSFIGLTLDVPPEDRLEGTAAAVAVAITRGADVVRVHDVAAMVRVARMTDAVVRRPSPHTAGGGTAR